MSMRRLFLAVPVLLAACGEETGTTAGDPPSPAEEAHVTCGGPPGWPPSVMADGLPGVLTDQEVEAAFRQFLADPQLAQELELSFLRDGADDTEWRVLAVDGEEFTLGLNTWSADGPEGDDAWVFGMSRDGDTWDVTGGGSCRLEPVLPPGETWVQVTEPDGGLDRDTTRVTVGVNERECTSGRDPLPHLNEPEVVETEESVTVYWTSRPPAGGQDCVGNPPAETTLELAEPLGDRVLSDGSQYPPQPVGPPPY